METIVPPAFATPPTMALEPVGHCIYCGALEGMLTKEHIIPSGLNGSLVLPKSSCKQCQSITSLIEEKVLKGFLYNSRLTLGMRTSGKRWQQPKSIKMILTTATGGSYKRYVPLAEMSAMLMLPMFVPPKFMTTCAPFVPDAGIEVMALPNVMVGKSLARLLQSYGAVGIKGKNHIDVPAFSRMLSKIAYAYHVAMRGSFPREESPALAVMFGVRTDMGTWVGCKDHTPLKGHKNVWHEIGFEDTNTVSGHPCTLVHISLFDQFKPCTYTVVTRAPNWQILTRAHLV